MWYYYFWVGREGGNQHVSLSGVVLVSLILQRLVIFFFSFFLSFVFHACLPYSSSITSLALEHCWLHSTAVQ